MKKCNCKCNKSCRNEKVDEKEYTLIRREHLKDLLIRSTPGQNHITIDTWLDNGYFPGEK